MPANKGQIDVALGEKFLADHWDTYEGKEDRNFRGLVRPRQILANAASRPGTSLPYNPDGCGYRAGRRQHDGEEHDAAGARRTSLRRRLSLPTSS